MSFFRQGRPPWNFEMEPNVIFYNDLWNYRTIQLELVDSTGRINTKVMNSLNTKLKRIFKFKVWYSKTYINDIGLEVKPAYQMKIWDDTKKEIFRPQVSPHILNYNPSLQELNENLIKNIGYYLVPSNILVKNPTKYGVTKQQTDELFGLLKSDYTLVKHDEGVRIYNLINWRLTNPMEVKE
jgi:hypothetical protein